MADFLGNEAVASFDPSLYYNSLKELVDSNNEFDQSVMEFNAQEAQKNRDWQERMSNTAHQREVADLLAAGLNPVLSAKLGGASSPTGSSASGQNTSSGVLSNVFGAIVNSATNMASKLIERQNVMDQILGNIQVGAGYNAAAIQAAAMQAASAANVAQINQDTQLATNKLTNQTSKENTLTSAKSNEAIQSANREANWDINEYNQALQSYRYYAEPQNLLVQGLRNTLNASAKQNYQTALSKVQEKANKYKSKIPESKFSGGSGGRHF